MSIPIKWVEGTEHRNSNCNCLSMQQVVSGGTLTGKEEKEMEGHSFEGKIWSGRRHDPQTQSTFSSHFPSTLWTFFKLCCITYSVKSSPTNTIFPLLHLYCFLNKIDTQILAKGMSKLRGKYSKARHNFWRFFCCHIAKEQLDPTWLLLIQQKSCSVWQRFVKSK